MRTKRPRGWEEGSGNPCLPHELVTELLTWLPVKSLLRFRSVCKAWRSTISDDPSFGRAHQQRQTPSLLIFPSLGEEDDGFPEHDWWRASQNKRAAFSSTIGLYQWAPRAEVTSLVHAADMPPERRREPYAHDVVAHCDGLLLVPTWDSVHLLNPAMRQVVTLPWSPGSDAPPGLRRHQALGLGRDPRSGAYKVARFFYRRVYMPLARGRGGFYGLATGIEVFTVAADDRHWREIAAQPPFPAKPDSTATFVKGSLLWVPDDGRDGVAAPPGFLRLSLEDESLGVTAPPPCSPKLDYARSCCLGELRGEVYVARVVEGVLELWMSEDVVRPCWERRYAIAIDDPNAERRKSPPRPVVMFHDSIVFHVNGWFAYAYDFRTRGFEEIGRLDRLDYHGDHHSTAAIADRRALFSQIFLIPYRESLLSVHLSRH